MRKAVNNSDVSDADANVISITTDFLNSVVFYHWDSLSTTIVVGTALNVISHQ